MPKAAPARILFITATRIGDAVLSTGVLAWLLRCYPNARVTIACGAPAAPLFAACPALEALHVMHKRKRAGHWRSLWRQVVTKRWDIVVDLRGSATPWLIRARHRLAPRPKRDATHKVVELQRAFHVAQPPAPTLWLPAEAEARAASWLPQGAPILAIAPTANWLGKQWPIERFIALIQRLTDESAPFAGWRVAAFGAPQERSRAEPLFASLPVLDGFALGGLIDVAAALARADLFIGNDSGLMHMSAALGVPTLGLFGPSDDRRYGPFGPKGGVVRTVEPFDALIARVDADRATEPTLMATLTVDAAYDGALALATSWVKDKLSPAMAAR